MKTLMDLHRHYPKKLKDRAMPFIEMIEKLLSSFPALVKRTFDDSHSTGTPGISSTPNNAALFQSPRPGSPMALGGEIGSDTSSGRGQVTGANSFKVFFELPIILVAIFHSNPDLTAGTVKSVIPQIKDILMTQAGPQEESHKAAAAKGDIFTGVSSGISNRAAFGEFVAAQVKILGFFSYALRNFPQAVNDFLKVIPAVFVRLLKDCPTEKSSCRKELLAAMRHIINFNYRKIFLPHIDDFLDPRILLGDSLTVHETMRALAYSMLADLIHHVRLFLLPKTVRKAIDVYTKNLMDSNPGTGFQTMSVKLLVNVIETVAKMEDKVQARHFLMMVLDAFAEKFAAMNRTYSNAIKLSEEAKKNRDNKKEETYLADPENPPQWDEVDIFSATPILPFLHGDRQADPIGDGKFLIKNLIQGVKTVIFQLRTCNPKTQYDETKLPEYWSDIAHSFKSEEVNVIRKLFREGAYAFRYYGTERTNPEIQAESALEYFQMYQVKSTEEKGHLEIFSTVFSVFEPATFYEVIQPELPRLYEMILDHPSLIHIPQFLLASTDTSTSFCGVLLDFLLSKLEDLGTSDIRKGAVLLRLWKLTFMTVTLFSDETEQILLPHTSKFILKCLSLSKTAEEPSHYFQLLKSCFRAIGGGKFESIYKEVLPLLETMLDNLNTLLMSSRKTSDRELFVVLILTVPVRLSHLHPHLSSLMRALVIALRSKNELLGQGLRTLELFVDNLTAEYVDPIMAPVMDELMTALWDLLKPLPFSHLHAHTAVKILGKLGGRNRRFWKDPPKLPYRAYADDESSFNIKLVGSSQECAFPATMGIAQAYGKLLETPSPGKALDSVVKADPFYKQQAFKLISSQLKLFLGSDSLPSDFAQKIRLQTKDLISGNYDNAYIMTDKSDRSRSVTKRNSEEMNLRTLLKALIYSTTVPSIKEEATALLQNICHHFVLLEIGRHLSAQRQSKQAFAVHSGEGLMFLEAKVLTEAILDMLSHENPTVRENAEKAIGFVRSSIAIVFASEDSVEKHPFFGHFIKTFCHACYEEEWFVKAGGCLGIQILTQKLQLSESWLTNHHLEFIRALMYVIKDVPPEMPVVTADLAQDVMISILKSVSVQFTKEQVSQPGSRIQMITSFYAFELCASNATVRKAAQTSLESLAESLQLEVGELMAPVKDKLFKQIVSKPLRALPFTTQIGYIDGLTYYLGLHGGLIEFNDDLNRILMEALALADAEDDTLSGKPHDYRTAESIHQLRTVCIRVLAKAMSFDEFGGGQQIRPRIISVFFKSLYSKSEEVIEAANIGLKGALPPMNKLPKDLLQNALRPILVNLQDTRRLNVAGMEGLARLLKLLTTSFKIEIGTRLLEHLKNLSEPGELLKTSFKQLEHNQNIKVIASILNVYHLLPDGAVTFMESLVNIVIDLEGRLRRSQGSPFRAPLTKYLVRYPEAAWKFFSTRLQDRRYGLLLSQILIENDCEPLREFIRNDVDTLIKAFDNEDRENRCKASISAILILYAVTLRPEDRAWLVSKPELWQKLLKTAKDFRQQIDSYELPYVLRLAAEQSEDYLMQVLLIYLEESPQDLNNLFDMVEAITSKSLKETWLTRNYIYHQIISSDSVDYWKTLILKSFDAYGSKDYSHQMKTYLFQNFVNPILAMDVLRSWNDSTSIKESKLLDRSMIDAVNYKIWKPNQLDLGEDSPQDGIDHSRLVLLQMSAMLFKWHWKLLAETRKDAIKFGWNYIKLEDTINKHAAYVVLAYFIHYYETPSKIVLQVYVALLKAYHSESKWLVTQALTIIAQVITIRVQPPIWARWAKKILTEDGHNTQQLMAIFNFMVKWPALFYDSRKDFVSWIVTSLHKIVPSHQQSNDAKRLVLKLLNMLLTWERMSEEKEKDKMKDEDEAAANTDSYTTPVGVKTAAIKFLIQFICSINERFPVPFTVGLRAKYRQPVQSGQPVPQSVDICKQAMTILKDLLHLPSWSSLDINLSEKTTSLMLTCDEASKPPEKLLNMQINALTVIRIVLNVKSDEWILEQLPTLQTLLEKPLRLSGIDRINVIEMQECIHSEENGFEDGSKLRSLMGRIMDVIPNDTADDEDVQMDSGPEDFINEMSKTVTDLIANHSYYPAIYSFWSLGNRLSAPLEKPLEDLNKWATEKLARDNVAAYTPSRGATIELQAGEEPIPQVDTQEFEIQAHVLIMTIDVFVTRMMQSSEKRRSLLSLLASLAEKSYYMPLCEKILSMVESWVFDTSEPYPTLKEKTAVLNKMLLWGARPDQTLLQKFLDLIIRIYEDTEIARTELTVRLEHAFLVGTRTQDVDMRKRFMRIFNGSINRLAVTRFTYVIGSQSWEALADSYWLNQASWLLVGSLDEDHTVSLQSEDFKTLQLSKLLTGYDTDMRKDDIMLEEHYEEFMLAHRVFCNELATVKGTDVIEPLRELQMLDKGLASDLWTHLFPIFWSLLPKEDRLDFEKAMVTLLTKDFHHRQADKRHNVVQALLDGCAKAKPTLKLPPQVIRFVSKSYDAWYTAMCSLEEAVIHPIIDTPAVRESTLDALVELYAGLQEDDMFYGTWRRRCQYVETNAALSYEQIGMWEIAQKMYEAAQIKARTGAMPFSQGEYMLWEDHWVQCAEKLQQWDILSDLAKHENYNDLLLECAWRQVENWSSDATKDQLDSIIKGLMDSPTPRRIFFQAFMSLLKCHAQIEGPNEFTKVCDEAVQLSLRKWHQLPKILTKAHIPLLLNFQQLVELHDANAICKSLSQTTQANLDTKSQELKMLLGAWRVRLPNLWDDINAWQNLVTWRQHIFTLINNTYIPLIPTTQATATNNNSYAYRGYHETAWIMNRFAHVARKHNLPEVCTNQLSQIYTLPNIEIQEAFLKLREQAKCHYQNKAELNSGLDVIKNTNLNYFGAGQKAEFFTLKGMFLAKLNQSEEANNAFGTALSHDLKLPKAWEEWGYYNDQAFKQTPTDLTAAAHAVSCYLEAAGLFRNHKSRKLIGRMLWLLSLDDSEGKIGSAFEEFKGDTPVWYWITYIPQLLNALAHKEGRIARVLLARIAKTYPQALFFLLRTSREDYGVLKKQNAMVMAQKAKQQAAAVKPEQTSTAKEGSAQSTPKPANGDAATPVANGSASKPAANGATQASPTGTPAPAADNKPAPKKMPWEYTDELLSVLKTAFPLLALSMETLVDQIQKHSKCNPDEDAYRLIVALLNDGLSYIGRMPTAFSEDVKLPPATEANIVRFAETILPPHIRSAFEADFVAIKPNLYTYIQKLRYWRDRFEEKLETNPNAIQGLESVSPHLSEFRFQKFEEVEIPGQYLELKDSNKNFIKIDRILPNVERVKSIGITFRRMQMRGHDGSVHPFAVQQPTGRLSRREERIIQLLRIFNSILAKRTQTRRRNLSFHLPLMVPLGSSLRLVQDDASNISLQGIFENHCRTVGMNKDDPILFTMKKLKKLPDIKNPVSLYSSTTTSKLTVTIRNIKINQSHSVSKLSQQCKKQWYPILSSLTTSKRCIHPLPTSGSSGDNSLIKWLALPL
jgi:transformation/transcription domain-associated protein